jgi:ubiquinone/menaquinone biosynthesis C-methylase UbiE
MSERTGARLSYRLAQGMRVLWYGAHYALVRRTHGAKASGLPRVALDVKGVRKAFFEVFAHDERAIAEGLYPPPRDADPRRLARALRSSRAFLSDAGKVQERRERGGGVEVRDRPDADGFPTYYRQNFHYQTDGWFSEESAALYPTQVEVLFTGAAAPMRRLAVAEIAREVRRTGKRDASLIDIAGGEGGFLADVLDACPKVKATLLDLSPAYCAAAKRRLKRWTAAEVLEGAAEAMPVSDARFDIASAVYLFHELPPRVRPQVISEAYRVLRPGGLFILADALQAGDDDRLEPLLGAFPEMFHEPYFKSWMATDLDGLMAEAGFVSEGKAQGFLTKATLWRKPG